MSEPLTKSPRVALLSCAFATRRTPQSVLGSTVKAFNAVAGAHGSNPWNL